MEADVAQPLTLCFDGGENVLFFVWPVVVGVGDGFSCCVGIGFGMKVVQMINEKIVE